MCHMFHWLPLLSVVSMHLHTTRQPRDRPSHSTMCPQEEGTLCNSSYHHAHHSKNHHVLQQPLSLLPPPPTMMVKARVRVREMGKATTTAPTTTAGAATPQRGPPSTIPRPAPCQCCQGCASLAVGASTVACPACCTSVL
jgi:hypothetical protein